MTTTYHVHPAADVFPMLNKGELKDLAADIRANGQQHPIVYMADDGKNLIIDGRNRMEACRLAKVDAEFTEFGGTEEDVVPYIISSNLARRHMTKGQRAMAAVMMLNNSTVREASRIVGVDKGYISLARQVYEADPNLAKRVVDNEVALADAHANVTATAKARRAVEAQRKKFIDRANKMQAELTRLEESIDSVEPESVPPPPIIEKEEINPIEEDDVKQAFVDSMREMDPISDWVGAFYELAKNPPDLSDIPSEPGGQQMTAAACEAAIRLLEREGRKVSIALMQAVSDNKTLRSVS